ncbi:MAG: DNA-directed RNA polymerase [Candidatus Micrarchaeaceae archaeon]
MYAIYRVKDTVSLPPKYLGKDEKEAALEVLRNKYERTFDKNLGIIVEVSNVNELKGGNILPGEPNIIYEAEFEVLAYKLEVEELVVGKVGELTDFGCFVRIGPVDGLVHLSQITDEFMKYDRKAGIFASRGTGKTIKKGDLVIAKVSTVSTKTTTKDIRIALTMRGLGLGKPEWSKIVKKERKAQAK